jgi:hypothetical protein
VSDFNVGQRVYDLKLFRLTGHMVKGIVVRESNSRHCGCYVEWDCDPTAMDFVYDDELDVIE